NDFTQSKGIANLKSYTGVLSNRDETLVAQDQSFTQLKDGAVLNAEIAGNVNIDHLKIHSGSTFNLLSLMDKDKILTDGKTGSKTPTFGGNMTSKTWELNNGNLNVTIWGTFYMTEKAAITGGSTVNLRSYISGISNLDRESSGVGQVTQWKVADSTMNAILAGDLFIDHLVLDNATVEISSLTGSDKWSAVSTDAHVNGGGRYSGTDLTINGGTTILDFYGEYQLDAVKQTGGTFTLTSRNAGMDVKTMENQDNGKANIKLQGDLTVTDTMTVKNGSHVTAVADGNMNILHLVGNNGILELNTNNLTSKDWNTTNSQLTMDAKKVMNVETANSTGGKATINAGNGIEGSTWTLQNGAIALTTDQMKVKHLVTDGGTGTVDGKDMTADSWNLANSQMTLKAENDISVGNVDITYTAGDNNKLTVIAGGNLYSPLWNVNKATAEVQVAGDIQIDELTTDGADFTMSATTKDGKPMNHTGAEQANGGGTIHSTTWNFKDSAVNIASWGDIHVDSNVSVKDENGSNKITKMKSYTGNIKNNGMGNPTGSSSNESKAQPNVYWIVDSATMEIVAANNIDLGAMALKNGSNVTVISLRNAQGVAVENKEEAKDGGLFIVNGDLFIKDTSKLTVITREKMIVTGEKHIDGEDGLKTDIVSIKLDGKNGEVHSVPKDVIIDCAGMRELGLPESISGTSARLASGIYFFFDLNKGYADVQDISFKVYDVNGKEVYNETTKSTSAITPGTVAFVSSGILTKGLPPNGRYRYQITMGDQTVTGWFVMPEAAVSNIETMHVAVKNLDDLGMYKRLAEAIDGAADGATLELMARVMETIVVKKELTILRTAKEYRADNLSAGEGLVMRSTSEEYKFRYEGFEVTYSQTEEKLNVGIKTLFDKNQRGDLMVAAYDADGKMIGMTTVSFRGGDSALNVDVNIQGRADTVKVFWLAPTTCAPISKSKTQTN
ncbi:MAG: hypothetical protein RR361_01395, partial [Anaerovorax sp.]